MKKINLRDKLVLLRIDINSPVVSKKVLDSPRFGESGKIIAGILRKGVKLVILAHQGRKGNSDFTSLEQHARILSRHVGKKIEYVDDLFGDKALGRINELKNGEAILMKNVRNYEEETDMNIKKNRFVEFSKLFDVFINEAFSDSHRKHSSIIVPPRYIPSAIGPEFKNEIEKLNHFAIHKKFRNTTIILGGSKVSDYFPLFKFLEERSNKIIAGGVIGNLFLKIEGVKFGYEDVWFRKNGYLKLMKEISRIYNRYRTQIVLPIDFALAGKKRNEFSLSKTPYNRKIMDIGHESVEKFKAELNGANRIIMKGPLGFSEYSHFAYGTREIIRFVSSLNKKRHIPFLLGGGHLSSTASKDGLGQAHVSLAGGATIQYLSEGRLPGLEAITASKRRFELRI